LELAGLGWMGFGSVVLEWTMTLGCVFELRGPTDLLREWIPGRKIRPRLSSRETQEPTRLHPNYLGSGSQVEYESRRALPTYLGNGSQVLSGNVFQYISPEVRA
jgi:hypothetical protein